MAENPYDRRQGLRKRPALLFGQAMGEDLGFPSSRLPVGLAIEDLHALAESARARGARQQRERLGAEHADELLEARRLAWGDGYVAGLAAGRDRVLAAMAAHHVLELRSLRERAWRQLLLLKEDPRRVTKELLRDTVDAAVDVVDRILEGLQDGFDTDPEDEPAGRDESELYWPAPPAGS